MSANEDDFVANPEVFDEEAVRVVARSLANASNESRDGSNPSGSGTDRRVKTTRSMSVDSIDSVRSYTGRISFLVNPDVIEFEDLPGEERGNSNRQSAGEAVVMIIRIKRKLVLRQYGNAI